MTLTAFYQSHGVRMIPNVIWSDPASYSYAFIGPFWLLSNTFYRKNNFTSLKKILKQFFCTIHTEKFGRINFYT